MNHRAVFLDTFGAPTNDLSFNLNPDHVCLSDQALSGLKRIQDAGYKLIVVANQPGVAHGRFREEELQPVIHQYQSLLKDAGIYLDAHYYCPHHPKGRLEQYTQTCFCRIPNPGMIFRAGREHDINLGESWMIGYGLEDIDAGQRTDCRTILIANGSEIDWPLTFTRRPNHTAGTLGQAAEIILAERDRPRAQVIAQSILRRSSAAAMATQRQ